MNSSIIQLVPMIQFCAQFNAQCLEQLLRAVVASELPQLKNLKITHLSDPSINPELLSEAVVRLEEFALTMSGLSTDQHRAILDRIVDTEDLRLKRLFGRKEFLSNIFEIPADIRMKAAVRLECTDIVFLRSPQERVDWYKFVAESPIMNLKRMVIEGAASHVPFNVLAAALTRVEDVRAGDFPADQSIALLKLAGSEDSKLKKLEIIRCDLSGISPDIWEEAIVSLKRIDFLNYTNLTPDQLQRIFTTIANCESLKLTELRIYDGNISSVPADVLAKAIPRLESIELRRTNLTPNQAQHLFTKIADCENLKLTELEVFWNNLSSVSADVLAKAISRVKTVDLLSTDLTPKQVQRIFQMIANCENLKLTELQIGWTNLSSVSADVLAKAISRVETVYLINTDLTPKQVQRIFQKIANCENLKLTKLHIDPNNLSSVPEDVLAKAKSRLDFVFCNEGSL